MAAARFLSDTDPDVTRLLSSLYARMTPVEKLRRMQQITLAVNRLAFAGMRRRHPTETDQELLLRLARLRLGDALVEEVYFRRAPFRGP